MAAGKKKPVRWTIPDVRGATARRLEAHTAAKPSGAAPYPSAAQFMAEGTYSRGWLEGVLRAVLTPVAIASAVSLGASGCVDVRDVAELLEGDEPASVYIDGASPPPATLTPIGAPGEGYGSFSGLPFGTGAPQGPPSKPPVTSSPDVDIIPPCPLPPAGQQTSVTGTTPPAHPPRLRGRMPAVAPLPPPPPPAADPPALDGEIAVVRPEPLSMPGGQRVVHPTGDGGT
ncbi:MAG: hypothetical protein JRH11_12750 [Deltaproteobacteria bacterium]|nr:hypothetical protein [Deltaproteobacteria bacterium]